MTDSDDGMNEDMPQPPDLTYLFQDQTQKLKKAFKASSDAFTVFSKCDATFGALTATYQLEIVSVLTTAKAVTTPPTAIASVPIVLAAANIAFAQALVTEQTMTSMIEQSFSGLETTS